MAHASRAWPFSGFSWVLRALTKDSPLWLGHLCSCAWPLKSLQHLTSQLLFSARLLLLFSPSAASDSLLPHGLQHTRPPCPSQSQSLALCSATYDSTKDPGVFLRQCLDFFSAVHFSLLLCPTHPSCRSIPDPSLWFHLTGPQYSAWDLFP